MSLNALTATVYISLGSNLGDRAANLLLAVRGMIEAGLEVERLSRIYETEAVETFAQPVFLNLVAAVRCSKFSNAEDVMRTLLEVEASLGRTRDTTPDALKAPRLIDLDLLMIGNQTSDTALLQLPHPRFHRRRFVLVPFAELAPQLVHPTLNKTIAELLQELDDRAEVKLWNFR
jgi:2-amino-4-hydroxy-6-hydroxymethyldihydropteridine diphosphokinase